MVRRKGQAELSEPAERQIDLLPPEPPRLVGDGPIALALLPPDEELVGESPGRDFLDSLRRWGMLQPVILAMGDGSRYLVAAGRRRVKAARALGWTAVPARVYAVDGDLADLITLVENAERRPNPANELEVIERLLARGASRRDITIATGMRPPVIARRLRLRGLIQPLREALRQGRIATAVAEDAAFLVPQVQEELARHLADHGRLLRTDVRAVKRVQSQTAAQALADVLVAGPMEAGRISDMEPGSNGSAMEPALQTGVVDWLALQDEDLRIDAYGVLSGKLRQLEAAGMTVVRRHQAVNGTLLRSYLRRAMEAEQEGPSSRMKLSAALLGMARLLGVEESAR